MGAHFVGIDRSDLRQMSKCHRLDGRETGQSSLNESHRTRERECIGGWYQLRVGHVCDCVSSWKRHLGSLVSCHLT